MSPSALTTDAPAAITPYLTLPLHHGSLLSVTIIGPTWADSDGLRLEQQLADTSSHGELVRTHCCHYIQTLFWCTVFPSSQQTEQGVWRSNQRCMQFPSETSVCCKIFWYCKVEFLFRQLSRLGLNNLLCFSSNNSFIATSPLTLTTDPPAAITSYLTLLLPHGSLSRERIDNTCMADLWLLAGLLQNSILCFSILFVFGLWIYFS